MYAHKKFFIVEAITLMTTMTLAGNVPAPFEIQRPDFKTYDFADSVPTEFQAAGGSSLNIDRKLFMSGGASLRWSWDKPGATLRYHCPEAFEHLTGENPDPVVHQWVTCTTLSALAFWVYCPKPLDGELWMEVGKGDGQTACRFPMKLNFSGWREFRALYGRDMPAFPPLDADTLRFAAPADVTAGALNFALFCPRTELDVRFVRATAQTPWVATGTGPWINGNDAPRAEFVPETPGKLSEAQLTTLGRLTGTVLAPYAPPAQAGPMADTELAALRDLHTKRGFVRDGDRISGGLGTIGGNAAYSASAGDQEFWGEAQRLAAAWLRADAQPKLRQELEDMFLDYADLCVQHGFGAGYATRDSFARPILWMKEPLQRRGRLQPLLAKLRGQNGLDGELRASEPWANADVYNTLTGARLFLIFVQDAPLAKHCDLKALQHWLESTARLGEIRPDGSFFHHAQTYSGYNLPAIGPLAELNHLLAKTEYAAPTSLQMAKRSAKAMNFYSCHGSIPHVLSGRWRMPGDFAPIGRQLFWQLAECGEPLDQEMAAIHLYHANLSGKDDEHAAKYRELGIRPWTPEGHLSLNYTVAAIHRRGDWMMFFRGQRNPFISFESYASQTANAMGRYLNYGHMAIISSGEPPSEEASGFRPQEGSQTNRCTDFHGWDFNFWPGTTARKIPYDALRSHFEVEEMVTSQTFAVGTSLGDDGVFGMKLKEDLPGFPDPTRIGPNKYWLGETEYGRRVKDSMYDPAFQARKSVFCFDNRILCLGSNIHSSDPDHRVCTTLFQRHLTPEDKLRLPFPEERRVEAGCLLDRNGEGYYLAPGNDRAILTRARCDLPYHPYWCPNKPEAHKLVSPNAGDTELAVLDHGAAPDSKGYEYCVVMRAGTDSAMGEFAARMADPKTAYYRVLQKNAAAHVVEDMPSKTFAYVLFEPGANLPGPLVATDRPCVAMLGQDGHGKLRLSVCDPEIGGDPMGVTTTTTVQLQLKGHWATMPGERRAVAKAVDGDTELDVACSSLMPVELELQQLKESH